MRFIVTHSDDSIVQVAPSSNEVGATFTQNGCYMLNAPDGVTITADTSAYVLTGGVVDVNSVVTSIYQGLSAQYPMYEFIEFNSFVSAADVALIDPTSSATLPVPFSGTHSPRFQSGRGSGGNPGVSPTCTAILPRNAVPTPDRPGMLQTVNIDVSPEYPIGPATYPDTFTVYWDVWEASLTEDVNATVGAGVGVNSPATKTYTKVDPDSSDLAVFLSNDSGTTYTAVDWMQQATLPARGADLKLCFINSSTSKKVYLLSYAIMHGNG